MYYVCSPELGGNKEYIHLYDVRFLDGMKQNETERKYNVNGMDCRFVSFVPAPSIGTCSSGGGIAQVAHRSAVEQVVTLSGGVTVKYHILYEGC